MLDFDSIRLEIKELRNVIGDENNQWMVVLYSVDKALMDAWISCKQYDTQDDTGVLLDTYYPEYKTVNKGLYNALVEIDDAVYKIQSVKGRISKLIDEIRDSSTEKHGVWCAEKD